MAEVLDKQKVLNRLGRLKADRASWFSHWQELTTYLLPRSGRYFISDRNKGWKRHNNIYDSVGSKSLKTLAAGLMGGLTSPARPWFRLGTRDRSLEKSPAVKLWLAECTRTMLDIFSRSNTYRALHSAYGELGAFGTSCNLMVEDFDTVIHHHPQTAGEFCIAQDWKGRVCTFYREFERTTAEMVKEFGYDKCSGTVQKLYDSGNLDAWVPIMQAIEPREDRDVTKRDNLNMPWRSVFYEIGGDKDKPLREAGYKRYPSLSPRWEIAGGDIYGNSPGMEALGMVKQLQQEQMRKSQGIDYMTNPPLQLPSSMKNREVARLPGGMSYYDGQTAAPVKTMFDVRLDLSHLLEDIQDVRQQVRGAFFADIFLMMQGNVDTTKTATEVAELHEEKMLMLGPVLERLHDELLSPLIDYTFTRMLETGIVGVPPDELQGQEITVELVSVLAQAQRAISTNSVDRFVMHLGSIATMKPEVLDKFDADEWADRYSDMLGVDPEMIVGSDKVALIRQQKAEMAQQAMQSQQQEQQAATAQKLAQVPTQGGASNAASDVINQFQGYTP